MVTDEDMDSNYKDHLHACMLGWVINAKMERGSWCLFFSLSSHLHSFVEVIGCAKLEICREFWWQPHYSYLKHIQWFKKNTAQYSSSMSNYQQVSKRGGKSGCVNAQVGSWKTTLTGKQLILLICGIFIHIKGQTPTGKAGETGTSSNWNTAGRTAVLNKNIPLRGLSQQFRQMVKGWDQITVWHHSSRETCCRKAVRVAITLAEWLLWSAGNRTTAVCTPQWSSSQSIWQNSVKRLTILSRGINEPKSCRNLPYRDVLCTYCVSLKIRQGLILIFAPKNALGLIFRGCFLLQSCHLLDATQWWRAGFHLTSAYFHVRSYFLGNRLVC